MSERKLKFWMEPEPPAAPPTMREIAAPIAERHSVSLAELRTPSRARYLSRPRLEAYAAIYATGRYSYLQIARFFGREDHSTVAKGIRARAARLAAGA